MSSRKCPPGGAEKRNQRMHFIKQSLIGVKVSFSLYYIFTKIAHFFFSYGNEGGGGEATFVLQKLLATSSTL